MPAWNELLSEHKAARSNYDIIRRKYLKRLALLTRRNIIIYYSGWLQKPNLVREPGVDPGITDADKNGLMAAIHKLDRSKGLDLILHTPGGDMAATESLVDYLRAMFGKDVRAFVPQLAMSGGTLIALSCKQIYMGKGSSIGPIDPQFRGVAATGLLQEFEKIRSEIKNDPSAALLWQPVLRQIEPGFVTECENAVDWAQNMGKRFLLSNMLDGEKGAGRRANQIVNKLTDKKTTKTHSRHIGVQEAQEIFGDKIVVLEDDQRLQDAVLSLHHACIITLDATGAYKIIENQQGRAFMQMVNQQIVPIPGRN